MLANIEVKRRLRRKKAEQRSVEYEAAGRYPLPPAWKSDDNEAPTASPLPPPGDPSTASSIKQTRNNDFALTSAPSSSYTKSSLIGPVPALQDDSLQRPLRVAAHAPGISVAPHGGIHKTTT